MFKEKDFAGKTENSTKKNEFRRKWKWKVHNGKKGLGTGEI